MAVIAMTREMGSLGKDVAATVAERLGLSVVHHELVEEALSARLGLQESKVHRYLEGHATLMERWKIDKARMSHFTAEEVLELAAKGNVIIRGWGAVGLLRDVRHVLRVRICAPLSDRTNRIKQRVHIPTDGQAIREVQTNDAGHAQTMRRFFNIDWQDPLLYDVVLNTARLSVAACADIVASLTQDPGYQETDASRAILQDRLVAARVRSRLDEADKIGLATSAVNLSVGSGTVELHGLADDDAAITELQRIVRETPGVVDVRSNLRHRAVPAAF